jgi:hypothetical protein
VACLLATHKRAQTVSGPPQSPTRSLEVSGSQTDLLTLWFSLEGKGSHTWNETLVTCNPRGKHFWDRIPPGPCVPHGGMSAPHCPLPSRSSQSRGLASSSSCRVPNCPCQESISVSHNVAAGHSRRSLRVRNARGSRRSYRNGHSSAVA